MKSREDAITEMFRAGFDALDKLDPDAVDRITRAIEGSLRQLRPEQFGALSRLPDPEGPIVDPRIKGAP
ncbi:MAG: hypothetical protein NT062_16445 [Proteobacteria bacterium]|nr:hypothetical protein [Pseudomonadota bacterium]